MALYFVGDADKAMTVYSCHVCFFFFAGIVKVLFMLHVLWSFSLQLD